MVSSAVISTRRRDEIPPDFDSAITEAAPRPEPLQGFEANALREINAQWREGLQPRAEQWIESLPDSEAQSELAVRIIYEEICLREQQGEAVTPSEIYRRFPQWQPALNVLLDCHRLMRPGPRFPQAGEQLGEFQLLRQLDQGAVGRVFLASQPALSDRPLVLKLTACSGQEHLSLARLQHTHIAPLYLVRDFPQQDLRALCMPYVGGASWARVLAALGDCPPGERSGRQIIEFLVTQDDAATPTSAAGPASQFLARAGYVQAVCWIGACLADALHYAHQRGLIHLDVKPGNVLVTGDGQPQLLDFHLASATIVAGTGSIERLGGTRLYMSPEQTLAISAVRNGQPIPLAIDGRSDVYSLGVLLFESLGGRLPSADELAARRGLLALNPQVSRGLEDVIFHCLEQNLAARYGDASSLATDLRRHLADLPLVGVPNRSPQERWRKWRRRRPHALSLALAASFAIAAIVVFISFFVGNRLQAARSALAQGQQQLDRRDLADAITQFHAGVAALHWLPGQHELKRTLQEQLSAAHQARRAEALHTLVERLRFIDDFTNVPTERLSSLQSGCRTIWQARDEILHSDRTATQGDDHTLRTDLLDLALCWVELQVALSAPNQAEQVHRDVLRLLDEAQVACGPSPVLDLVRQEHASALGVAATKASAPTPKTGAVWEHYAVGRHLLRAGKLAAAQRNFQQAVDLEPGAFWPNFQQSVCLYRLGDFDRALNAASVCVALSPRSAECYFNRALIEQALGQSERSQIDFLRAGQLDPSLAGACKIAK